MTHEYVIGINKFHLYMPQSIRLKLDFFCPDISGVLNYYPAISARMNFYDNDLREKMQVLILARVTRNLSPLAFFNFIGNTLYFYQHRAVTFCRKVPFSTSCYRLIYQDSEEVKKQYVCLSLCRGEQGWLRWWEQ